MKTKVQIRLENAGKYSGLYSVKQSQIKKEICNKDVDGGEEFTEYSITDNIIITQVRVIGLNKIRLPYATYFSNEGYGYCKSEWKITIL